MKKGFNNYLSPRPFGERVRGCNAFTLAEVLITLGIIGVVAAVTIPNVIKNYQKKVTVERLKSAYSIFSQAVNQSKTDNGDIETWDTEMAKFNTKGFAEKYLLPYLKSPQEIKQTYTPKVLYQESGYPYLHWWNSNTGSTHTARPPIYAISNGMTFVTSNMYVIVDLNGSKRPNVLGKDVFVFYLYVNKNQLLPYGTGYSREQLMSHSYSSYNGACVNESKSPNHYVGSYCAALIMLDGWKIEKDYPW